MPEIPELEAIRSFFNEQIAGRTITGAETRIPVVFRTGAAAIRETLPGDGFGTVERHGKFLLFGLRSGRVLAINPMLTGRFQYVDPKTKLPAKTCLRLEIDGGRSFRYWDDRLMGKIYLIGGDQLGLIPNWTENGPDLLDEALDEERWLGRIKKYRGQIKSVLTKAEFAQGIGNAYADEILWEAKVNPYMPRTKLDDEQLRGLFRSARAVMAWATPLVRRAW